MSLIRRGNRCPYEHLALYAKFPPLAIEKSGGSYCFLKTLLIPPWKDEMEVSNCGKTGKHESTQKPQARVLKGHWGLQVVGHGKPHSERCREPFCQDLALLSLCCFFSSSSTSSHPHHRFCLRNNDSLYFLGYRFINARRRIVQPMIDQSNRAGKSPIVTVFKSRKRKPSSSHSPGGLLPGK